MNGGWRSFRDRLRFVVILLLLSQVGVRSQSLVDPVSAANPDAFDTQTPSYYGLDYLNAPSDDPMSAMPGGIAPTEDQLGNPDTLDYRSVLDQLRPSGTPSDYRSGASMRSADYENEPAVLTSMTGSEASLGELTISDMGHPVFYDLSRTAAAFGLNETPLVSDIPLIPSPATTLNKPMAPRLKVGPWRFAFDALTSVSTIYNVLGSATNPQSDMAVSLTPRFYVEAGTKGSFRLLYSPTFTRFMRFSDLDSANQNLSIEVKYPFSKLKVGAVFSYLTQTGLFLNNQEGQGTQDMTMLGLSADYPLTTKINTSVNFNGMFQRSDPGGQKLENTVTFAANYGRGDKVSGGGMIQLGNVQSQTGTQDYISLEGEVGYRPDFNWRFSMRGGVNYRILNPSPYGVSSPLVEPIFDATASYFWNSNVASSLRLYRYIQTDTFNSVSVNIQTGVELATVMRAYYKTDLKFYLSFGYNEYFFNEIESDGNFSFVQGGLSASYTIIKWVDLTLFGSVQQRFADSEGLNYLSGTLGLGLFLRF